MLQTTKSTKKETIEQFLARKIKENPIVDISNLNLIEATKTAVGLSLKYYLSHPENKITWEVADTETAKNISILKLKNMNLALKSA